MQLTFKRFREFGRNFFTPNTELENLSCYATFAEKLLEVGDKKKAQALGTFIKVSSVNIWDRKEESERLAALRLALVYVNALGDDSKKCDAIASIVLRGTLPDDDKPMVYKSVEVQDRLNILLSQAIKNGFRNWEGAVLDILATLSVAFVYHKASTSDRYRFLCTTYESLQKVLDLSEMPRFTVSFAVW
ncbi:unnamed protein product [Anisakis simplex]|uniref:WHG domain-containing protein n=1 Tax=Anisakis simplex TaxID=6269 RepID=A0A0M3J834_ANISI|nr:unnamed protein product [Anisakis simplex]